MRIFLSLGMRGRDENDVLADIAEATHYAKSLYAESATDCEVINTYRQEGAPEDASRMYYLGRSIQILGSCDQVWFINDWENYRGCRAEHEVCKIYGIPCYMLDLRTARLRLEALDAPKTSSAYKTFQFFKQSISNVRDAICFAYFVLYEATAIVFPVVKKPYLITTPENLDASAEIICWCYYFWNPFLPIGVNNLAIGIYTLYIKRCLFDVMQNVFLVSPSHAQ